MERHQLSHNELVLLHTILSCRIEDLTRTILNAPEDQAEEITQADLNYRFDLSCLRHKIDRMVEFSK